MKLLTEFCGFRDATCVCELHNSLEECKQRNGEDMQAVPCLFLLSLAP